MNETLSSQQHTTIIWTVQQQQQQELIYANRKTKTRENTKNTVPSLSLERGDVFGGVPHTAEQLPEFPFPTCRGAMCPECI
jgi:hypothetical protein